jgi:hypothetical protein
MAADKALTELAWRTFAKGRGLKDVALGKALAELAKTDKDDPQSELPALDAVDAQCEVLRKTAKGNKDVLAYLDEIDTASSKRRALAELRAESQARAEEERRSPPLLTSKMLPLLRQVSQGETMQVMVALAGRQVAVLLSRRAISPSRRNLLKAYLGLNSGVKFLLGECLFEEDAHTFVFQSQVSGLAKRLRVALHEQTDRRVKVRVRGESAGVPQ